MAESKRGKIIWVGGGADRIHLPDDPEDKFYYPGQTVPLNAAQRAALARNGHLFATEHGDGEIVPIGPGRPAEIEQVVAERRAAEAALLVEREQQETGTIGGPVVVGVTEPEPEPDADSKSSAKASMGKDK